LACQIVFKVQRNHCTYSGLELRGIVATLLSSSFIDLVGDIHGLLLHAKSQMSRVSKVVQTVAGECHYGGLHVATYLQVRGHISNRNGVHVSVVVVVVVVGTLFLLHGVVHLGSSSSGFRHGVEFVAVWNL